MLLVGLEPMIPVFERVAKTVYALNRVATVNSRHRLDDDIMTNLTEVRCMKVSWIHVVQNKD
jgi:hypothetical protein